MLSLSLNAGLGGRGASRGGLFAYEENMGCSLGFLFCSIYSLQMKRRFRVYLLGVFWSVLCLLERVGVLEASCLPDEMS